MRCGVALGFYSFSAFLDLETTDEAPLQLQAHHSAVAAAASFPTGRALFVASRYRLKIILLAVCTPAKSAKSALLLDRPTSPPGSIYVYVLQYCMFGAR